DTVPIGHIFGIDTAPDVVVPYLSSLHLKQAFPHFPTLGRLTIPETLPDAPSSGSNEDFEFADCMGPATLPTQLGHTTSPFIMSTGLAVPSITATLAIETTVSNPAKILPVKSVSLGGFG